MLMRESLRRERGTEDLILRFITGIYFADSLSSSCRHSSLLSPLCTSSISRCARYVYPSKQLNVDNLFEEGVVFAKGDHPVVKGERIDNDL